jgi:hypothetical protein
MWWWRFGGVVVSMFLEKYLRGVFLFLVYGGWSLETKVVTWRLVMSLLFRGEVIVMVFGVWK